MPFWDFMGSTVVTSNYIRLTADLQSKSGAIWNTVVRISSKLYIMRVIIKALFLALSV